MSVPRGTTPTYTCTFSDESVDLTTATNVYVTLEQGRNNITKSGDDLVVSAKRIEVYLSQRDTLLLDGICFEPLSEEFDMSVRQIKNIVYKSQEQLFKHL